MFLLSMKSKAKAGQPPSRLESGVMPRVDLRRIDHRTQAFVPISEEEAMPSSGRMIDDDISFEEAPTRLRPISLAVPPLSEREGREGAKSTVTFHVRDEGIRPPPPSQRSLRLVQQPMIDTPATPFLAIRAFAGFPDVPESLLWAPLYALHVRARKKILREQLASARKRFSPDVELYEQALELADARIVRIGMICVVLACALPVVVALAILCC